MLQRLIKQSYPRSRVQVNSYGYPGASAQYLHACIDRMVPFADIYVVELADNFLATHAAYVEAGELVGQIVLHLRQRASALAPGLGSAVILIAPFAQSCSKPLLRSRGFEQLTADKQTTRRSIDRCLDPRTTLPAVMEAFAAQHSVACVSVRHVVAQQLRFHQNDSHALRRLLTSFLHDDLVHPNGVGHRMIAQMLVRTLSIAAARMSASMALAVCDRTDRNVAPPARNDSARRGGVTIDTLHEDAASWQPSYPAPAAHASASHPIRVCAMGDGLHSHVLVARGWAYEVERSTQGQPKPGYIANSAGASLDVCFRPPVNGSRDAAARWFQFAFLRSYEGMGTLHGACVDGCSCANRSFIAHHTVRVSEVVVSKLKDITPWRSHGSTASQRCPCVIRLRVLNETQSGGHKFKLVALFAGMRMYNPNFALCGQSRCIEREPQPSSEAHRLRRSTLSERLRLLAAKREHRASGQASGAVKVYG